MTEPPKVSVEKVIFNKILDKYYRRSIKEIIR